MEKLPSGLLVMQKALNKKLRSPHQVTLSRSRDPEPRSGSELWRGRLISYVVKRERGRGRGLALAGQSDMSDLNAEETITVCGLLFSISKGDD